MAMWQLPRGAQKCLWCSTGAAMTHKHGWLHDADVHRGVWKHLHACKLPCFTSTLWNVQVLQLFPKQASMLGQSIAEHVRISSQVLQSHQEGQKEPAPAIRHQPQAQTQLHRDSCFCMHFLLPKIASEHRWKWEKRKKKKKRISWELWQSKPFQFGYTIERCREEEKDRCDTNSSVTLSRHITAGKGEY